MKVTQNKGTIKDPYEFIIQQDLAMRKEIT